MLGMPKLVREWRKVRWPNISLDFPKTTSSADQRNTCRSEKRDGANTPGDGPATGYLAFRRLHLYQLSVSTCTKDENIKNSILHPACWLIG